METSTGAFICETRFSTSATAFTKSASILPQVGHEMIFTPSLTLPLSFNIAFATLISSSSSPV